MPMIDVYAPDDLFPAGADRQLAEELTSALLRAEGVITPSAAHLANTAAYIHRLDPRAVHTAGTRAARTVRVQVLTPPGALNRAGQKILVAEATEIVAKIAGDPTQGARTWVLLSEAAEGGWGIAGTAFGREEFAALAAGIAPTTSKPSSGEDATSAFPDFLDCDYFELHSSTQNENGGRLTTDLLFESKEPLEASGIAQNIRCLQRLWPNHLARIKESAEKRSSSDSGA
jgi:phenylpyruvate tautomerase PptA (4-oxalocrotonate tautomerase family)